MKYGKDDFFNERVVRSRTRAWRPIFCFLDLGLRGSRKAPGELQESSGRAPGELQELQDSLQESSRTARVYVENKRRYF